MEINHLLDTDDSGSIQTHNIDQVAAKLNLWLDTPKGTRWGDANWGHVLSLLKHEPRSSAIEVLMENLIIRHVQNDLPDIRLKGVRVEFVEADLLLITLNTQYGLIQTSFDRAK